MLRERVATETYVNLMFMPDDRGNRHQNSIVEVALCQRESEIVEP
jgi:hypothetical protein